MLTMELILAVWVVIFVCGFSRLPLIAWSAAFAALAALTASVTLVAVVLVVAAAVNIPFIRRKLVTERVLALYHRILPDMSQTEKEAIDAGTVWWDGDLFSGRPDFDKLLAVPEPRLSAEEQAFLDGPVEELCAMCNDWEITHELQDLPAHVWQFIKERGFLGMIIPKKYGGPGLFALPPPPGGVKISTRPRAAARSVVGPTSPPPPGRPP